MQQKPLSTCCKWSVFHNYNRANMYMYSVIIKNAIILNIMHKIFIFRDIHVVIWIILVKFVVLAKDLIFLWHDCTLLLYMKSRVLIATMLPECASGAYNLFSWNRKISVQNCLKNTCFLLIWPFLIAMIILLKVTLNTITLTLTLDSF